MARINITVIAHFTFDKRVITLKFMLTGGTRISVDKVLDMRRAASLRAGGTGLRYTIRSTVIQDEFTPSNEMYLWGDVDEWFIEGEDPPGVDSSLGIWGHYE